MPASLLRPFPVTDYLIYVVPLIVFGGAYLSTVAGMGGGLLILATCSQIMPINIVIPLNGVFVFAGQVTRTVQFWHHIDWRITGPFIPGAIIGALIGTLIYFSLSDIAIALLLGSVMLWFSWVPSGQASQNIAAKIPQPWFWVGIIHTFLSTVSGAGGLMQSLMVNSKLPKEGVVATIAGTLLAMSLFKTVGYFLAGFDYMTWLPLILLSWVTGVAGTALGRHSLNRMPDIFFRRLIKAMVTVFALRLFWRAASLALGNSP
jgi:uncharacterized membrane protein YfcA